VPEKPPYLKFAKLTRYFFRPVFAFSQAEKVLTDNLILQRVEAGCVVVAARWPGARLAFFRRQGWDNWLEVADQLGNAVGGYSPNK
jgi:hypothetical protein